MHEASDHSPSAVHTMGNRARRDTQALETAERDRQILELRKQGLTNDQIGARLGITEKRVRVIISRELVNRKLRVGEATDELVRCELERLELAESRAEGIIRRRLRPEIAEKVVAHDMFGGEHPLPYLPDKDAKVVLAALEEQRRCRAERAKYLELYGPEKHEHSGPGGGPIVSVTLADIDQAKAAIAANEADAVDGGEQPKG